MRIDGADARDFAEEAIDLLLGDITTPGLVMRPFGSKWTLRVLDAERPGVYPRTVYLKDDVAWVIEGDEEYVWDALDQLPEPAAVGRLAGDDLLTDIPYALDGRRRIGLYESTEPLFLPTLSERLGPEVDEWLLDLYLNAGVSPSEILGVIAWWGLESNQDGIQIEGYRLPETAADQLEQLRSKIFLGEGGESASFASSPPGRRSPGAGDRRPHRHDARLRRCQAARLQRPGHRLGRDRPYRPGGDGSGGHRRPAVATMGTEREVVVRAQKGDERAFEALVVAIHPRLFRLAHGILRDPALAEDAAQQSFLDSWRLLPRLRDPERFTAWSYRSLLDAADELAGRHPERLSPEPPPVLVPRGFDPFGTGADRNQVTDGFLALPFDSRCVIVLRYLLDLKVEEVAQALGVSTGAAASRLERALAEVRTGAGLGEGAVTDERLAADIAVWLHETDVTPPDARMSAGRVMAGVEGAQQLGRWWPLERSVPRARPVPALGAPREPDLPPPVNGPARPSASRMRSQLTPPRVLLAALLLVLAAGSLLLLPGLLSGSAGSTAMASPLPAPSVVASAAPTPSVAPTPTPTPVPTPSSAAESEFVTTRTLMPLEPGSDPASLGPGASRTAVFVDRAAGLVYEVAAEGEARVVASEGSPAGAGPMAAPVLAARGGRDIVIFDAAGQGWRPVDGAGPGLLEPLVRIDPATEVLSSTTRGSREYDLYLARARLRRHRPLLDARPRRGAGPAGRPHAASRPVRRPRPVCGPAPLRADRRRYRALRQG